VDDHSPCGGPAKGQKLGDPLCLPPPRGGSVRACTAGVCRVWHKQKGRWLIPEGLLKREDHSLSTLGLEIGLGYFYFHPLKRCRKLSGNKSHIEQPEAAYTEPGPLARGGATLPRKRHLRISAVGPSPRRQAGTTSEHQVYRAHRTANLQD